MKSFASEVYQAVKVGKLSQPFNAAMAKKDLKCLRNGISGNLTCLTVWPGGTCRKCDFAGT